jgi:hypothetical protein
LLRQQRDLNIEVLGGINVGLPIPLRLHRSIMPMPCLHQRGFGLASTLLRRDQGRFQRLQFDGGVLRRFVQARAFRMQRSRRFQRTDTGNMRSPLVRCPVRLMCLFERGLRLADGGFHAGQGLMPAQRSFQFGFLLFPRGQRVGGKLNFSLQFGAGGFLQRRRIRQLLLKAFQRLLSWPKRS